MDADRVERLVSQVLEEARALRQETLAFRQEALENFAAAAQERQAPRRDVGLVQTAVLEVDRVQRRSTIASQTMPRISRSAKTST